jgi:polar amino acid transport system substrate-binding protein
MTFINILAKNILLLSCLLMFTLQTKASDCQLSVNIEPEPENLLTKVFYSHSLNQQSQSLFKALIDKTDCTVETFQLPNERAVKMLNSGALTAMVGISKTVAREKLYYFVGSHHTERIVVVGRLDVKESVNSLNDILTLDGGISVMGGAYYGTEWDQALKSNPKLIDRLVYLSDNQRKLSMLVLNRVEFSLEDEQVVDALLKEKDYKDRFAKLFTLHQNPVYFAFSKKAISEDFYHELTEKWQQMQISGEVETIKNTHYDSLQIE